MGNSIISSWAGEVGSVRTTGSSKFDPAAYPDDPVGYFRNILRFNPTLDQIAIAEAIRRPPYRVLASSAHNTGKSALAAALVNWFYDSFRPSMCITTSPTMDSVKKIIWKEVRLMRHRAGLGDLQPKAPEMSDSPDHLAYGMTAGTGEGFQGRHELRTFFVFDESCDIDPVFWSVTRTMFKPEAGHMWLCLFNPTNTTSQAYLEDHSTDSEGKPVWTTIRMDALRHPNIVAQVDGRPPPIPAAVTLSQIEEWIAAWCDEIHLDDAQPTDLQWPPPGSALAKIHPPKWYRQGPEFQARCRGMWPEGGTFAVWSEIVWRLAETTILAPPIDQLPEIGCDVASYGLDHTSFHVRWGGASQAHESYQGWGAAKIFEHLKHLAGIWAGKVNAVRHRHAAPIKPTDIPIKIDDDPEGRAISEFLANEGYFVVPIGAATRSISGLYPNMRSELWFQLVRRARMGEVSFARLPQDIRNRMRQQAMAVTWTLDGQGRRVVEPKEITKEKIGRSPDDMDSVNLAYLQGYDVGTPEYVKQDQPRRDVWGQDHGAREGRRKKIFGV